MPAARCGTLLVSSHCKAYDAQTRAQLKIPKLPSDIVPAALAGHHRRTKPHRLARNHDLREVRFQVPGRQCQVSVVRRAYASRLRPTCQSLNGSDHSVGIAAGHPFARRAGSPRFPISCPQIQLPVLRVSRPADRFQKSVQQRLDFIRGSLAPLPPSLLAALRLRRLQRRSPQMRRLRRPFRRMKAIRMNAARIFQDVWRRSIGLCALVCFAAYVVWNIRWLAVGKIPPSALRFFLGIPCPTTGGTHSLLSLLRGDFHASLLWNPFTVPILILLALSGYKLIAAALRKKELLLPSWLGTAWASVLLTAWLAKFLLGPAYW